MENIVRTESLLEKLRDSAVRNLKGRSMLLTREWSTEELEAVTDLADLFETLDRAGVATPLFPNELFTALFFDNSTRTKSSWAGAAARLGGSPFVVDGTTTQVSHGETAEETGAMLGMNSHALGIRHDLILGEGNKFMREASAGIDAYLKHLGSERNCPVVNLQCDIDHPTQTLADLCWLKERFPQGLKGKTIAISWAYSPSYAKPLSVPQGLLMLLTRFGMNVRLAHPKGYDLLPECLDAAKAFAAKGGGSFTPVTDMDTAFKGADIVYPKSWGPHDLMLERVKANAARDAAGMKAIEQQALARNKLHTDWICDGRRMGLTNNALYMHCLPADIGAEVTADVIGKFRHELSREANKKVYVIMALLALAKSKDVKGALARLTK